MNTQPPVRCFTVVDGALSPTVGSTPPDALALHVHAQFRAMLLSPSYPCLGGTGAVRADHYRLAIYDRLGDGGVVEQSYRDLACFLRETPASEHPTAVFVAVFLAPIGSEAEFERALWRFLHGLERHGSERGESVWEKAEIADIEDPGFLLGDREFFVVGLNPAASRWARRFAWTTLVFNALTHSGPLRERDKHRQLSRRILARDHTLQGSDNPSLGFAQDAQFSGCPVAPGWRRPIE